MNKTQRLLEECIFPYHPEFKRSLSMRRFATRSSGLLYIEGIVEQTMAIVGGYKFIDGAHCDFSDGTDCKTASIRQKPSREGSQSHRGEISNVVTAGGGEKSGALRCIVYCAPRDRLDYYLLPKTFWEWEITVHPSSSIGKIQFSYHRGHDWVNKFEPFRLTSFEELARAPHNLHNRWQHLFG